MIETMNRNKRVQIFESFLDVGSDVLFSCRWISLFFSFFLFMQTLTVLYGNGASQMSQFLFYEYIAALLTLPCWTWLYLHIIVWTTNN